jgi:hypothetical protein
MERTRFSRPLYTERVHQPHGRLALFLPEACGPLGITGVGEYMIYLRSEGSAEQMVKQLEGTILSIDKDVCAQETLTMEHALDK